MEKFKKSVVLMLTTAILTSVTACSKGGATSNEVDGSKAAGDSGKPKEPVTVRILIDKSTNFPEDNTVVQEIRKRTGVNVQFLAVDSPDMGTKLNTMIASNDMPDAFLNSDKAKISELVKNQVIIPMDDLLNTYGKNIMDNKGSILKGVSKVDGKIYAIPRGWGFGSALAIRKDWLDKLKLPVPKTIDEYYATLKAFVNNDPDGNGQKDTIGLGAYLGNGSGYQTFYHIFAAYGVPVGRGKLIDGKVTPWVLQPGFMDGIKFLNKLYKEGLMEPDFATISNLKEFEKLWNGKMGAFDYTPNGTTQNWLTRYVENPAPEFEYTVIKGPNNQGGTLRLYLEDSGPWMHISKASKHPEEVMKVLDFLISDEGDKLTWAGIEGKHYKMDNGKFEWIKPYDDAASLRNEGGFAYNGVMNRIGGFSVQLLNDKTKAGLKLANDNVIEDAYLYEVPDIEREKKKVLDDIINEGFASLIISKGDLDKEYESFKKKYLDAGGQKWIDQATEIYKKEHPEKK
ncbi:extracellular solute-binding protein [Paenibacillus doosanensis]|uniref:extracellular solute-binding protein n=1 Tax=Paenibacillus doosanensis TaxID=1229154 RepID=UPI00217F8153|nr:extracellular solute-binding protein [Paenibacillus doosanensis]MCS7460074.1 extracellular solute-binding protein [Paenibacillus doosanensis]